MKALDLALAAMVGLTSIGLIYSWSPQAADQSSRTLLKEAALRDYLAGIVVDQGLVWLAQSSDEEICARLSALSNETVSVSATIDSEPCPHVQPHSWTSVSLVVELPSKEVVLEAWSNAKG